MRMLAIGLTVATTAFPAHMAIAQSGQESATRAWQTQVRDQPIRTAASVHDEFKTDQITISLEFSSIHRTFDGLIAKLRSRQTDIAREAEQASMRVSEITITNMELRQRRSDSDDYKYFGQITVLLTVAGFTDPLDVAAKLNQLPARSVGELKYSLSKTALKKAEDVLRARALEEIRRDAAGEAELRNTELGKMIRFSFETHVNSRKFNAQNIVAISGRGLAVFEPHAQE